MSDPEEKTMTFWEHLAELRSRIIKAAIAYFVGVAVAWYFRETLLLWVTEPFVRAWQQSGIPGSAKLHFNAPAALFIAYIKLSLIGGLVLSLPFLFHQLWAFVAPGLYSKEKRYALPFVVVSSLLFAAGAYFCFVLVFPNAFQYLLSFGGRIQGTQFEVTPTVMIEEYITFSLQMLVAFGVVFELPVLVFFLAVSHIVTYRHLIKYFRHFVVLDFIVAAVLTPPDPASQILLAIPLLVLYGVSIVIAYVFGRRDKPEPDA